jgi:hypothetical protein
MISGTSDLSNYRYFLFQIKNMTGNDVTDISFVSTTGNDDVFVLKIA